MKGGRLGQMGLGEIQRGERLEQAMVGERKAEGLERSECENVHLMSHSGSITTEKPHIRGKSKVNILYVRLSVRYWLCIHCKLYSSNKTRKQSRFTVNLIKAACLHCTPLCTAKSNLLSIWFTQRSIHLHWRLLGTICGY